jgi:hypothetical protein
MNFIKSGLQSVLGQPESDTQITGAETVGQPRNYIFAFHFQAILIFFSGRTYC